MKILPNNQYKHLVFRGIERGYWGDNTISLLISDRKEMNCKLCLRFNKGVYVHNIQYISEECADYFYRTYVK